MAKEYAKIDPDVIAEVGKSELRRILRKATKKAVVDEGKWPSRKKPDSN